MQQALLQGRKFTRPALPIHAAINCCEKHVALEDGRMIEQPVDCSQRLEWGRDLTPFVEAPIFGHSGNATPCPERIIGIPSATSTKGLRTYRSFGGIIRLLHLNRDHEWLSIFLPDFHLSSYPFPYHFMVYQYIKEPATLTHRTFLSHGTNHASNTNIAASIMNAFRISTIAWSPTL
ncbi:hypothetical protein [Paraburkholderia ferrariae]|uniref:Uncharacterized protein n=1 Tax=Paraburkholderia ferrariae TaxID=386056 RepID=A0ABU9S475_9BURK